MDADPRLRTRTRWVDRYRGLWGLDTGDRFAGERAPAGPKYTRTGSVRQSWADPLGFAGLDKVPPPSQAAAVLEQRIREIEAERAAVRSEAESTRVGTAGSRTRRSRRCAGAWDSTTTAPRTCAALRAEEAKLAALRARTWS